MGLLQFFLCLAGRHHRSRRHVVHDGTDFRSTCLGCGAPMLRTDAGWKLDRDPPAAGSDRPTTG
jgi:hypothetical protein